MRGPASVPSGAKKDVQRTLVNLIDPHSKAKRSTTTRTAAISVFGSRVSLSWCLNLGSAFMRDLSLRFGQEFGGWALEPRAAPHSQYGSISIKLNACSWPKVSFGF